MISHYFWIIFLFAIMIGMASVALFGWYLIYLNAKTAMMVVNRKRMKLKQMKEASRANNVRQMRKETRWKG